MLAYTNTPHLWSIVRDNGFSILNNELKMVESLRDGQALCSDPTTDVYDD